MYVYIIFLSFSFLFRRGIQDVWRKVYSLESNSESFSPLTPAVFLSFILSFSSTIPRNKFASYIWCCFLNLDRGANWNSIGVKNSFNVCACCFSLYDFVYEVPFCRSFDAIAKWINGHFPPLLKSVTNCGIISRTLLESLGPRLNSIVGLNNTRFPGRPSC